MFAERLPEFFASHPILSLAFIAITLALIANEFSRFTRGYKALTPALLTQLINRENALVVDVSPLNDFEKGHIVGSKNVVMSQFDPENKHLAPAKALPVVLVCKLGQTATDAAKRLRKAGFTNVSILEGGVQAWQGADMPVVKGKSR